MSFISGTRFFVLLSLLTHLGILLIPLNIFFPHFPAGERDVYLEYQLVARPKENPISLNSEANSSLPSFPQDSSLPEANLFLGSAHLNSLTKSSSADLKRENFPAPILLQVDSTRKIVRSPQSEIKPVLAELPLSSVPLRERTYLSELTGNPTFVPPSQSSPISSSRRSFLAPTTSSFRSGKKEFLSSPWTAEFPEPVSLIFKRKTISKSRMLSASSSKGFSGIEASEFVSPRRESSGVNAYNPEINSSLIFVQRPGPRFKEVNQAQYRDTGYISHFPQEDSGKGETDFFQRLKGSSLKERTFSAFSRRRFLSEENGKNYLPVLFGTEMNDAQPLKLLSSSLTTLIKLSLRIEGRSGISYFKMTPLLPGSSPEGDSCPLSGDISPSTYLATLMTKDSSCSPLPPFTFLSHKIESKLFVIKGNPTLLSSFPPQFFSAEEDLARPDFIFVSKRESPSLKFTPLPLLVSLRSTDMGKKEIFPSLLSLRGPSQKEAFVLFFLPSNLPGKISPHLIRKRENPLPVEMNSSVSNKVGLLAKEKKILLDFLFSQQPVRWEGQSEVDISPTGPGFPVPSPEGIVSSFPSSLTVVTKKRGELRSDSLFPAELGIGPRATAYSSSWSRKEFLLSGKRNLISAKTDDELVTYLNQIRDRIEEAKKYPSGAREKEKEGRVKVEITVREDGQVEDISVVASFCPLLDEAAVKLIKEVSPFPPFPSSIKQNKIIIQMEVIYELKEKN